MSTLHPVGYGYIQLNPGDLRQPGDQYRSRLLGWVETNCAGKNIPRVPSFSYRRKVDVGEGYELVPLGGTIPAGAEYKSPHDGAWVKSGDIGLPNHGHFVYRAPVKVNDGLPKTPWFRPTNGPGEGYRFLKIGETIQDGDEGYRRPGKWQPTVLPGDLVKAQDGILYRRKLADNSPGEGYRWLVAGEPLKPGDQYKSIISPGKWKPISPVAYGKPVGQSGVLLNRYRRSADYVRPPLAGEGFRLLEVGEQIKDGDQWFDGTLWHPTQTWQKVIVGNFFRRRMVGRAITFREWLQHQKPYNPEELKNTPVSHPANLNPLGWYSTEMLEAELARRRTVARLPWLNKLNVSVNGDSVKNCPDLADATALLLYSVRPVYRMLKRGQRIEPDDEVLRGSDGSRKWEKVGKDRAAKWEVVLHNPDVPGVYQFRRRTL